MSKQQHVCSLLAMYRCVCICLAKAFFQRSRAGEQGQERYQLQADCEKTVVRDTFAPAILITPTAPVACERQKALCSFGDGHLAGDEAC